MSTYNGEPDGDHRDFMRFMAQEIVDSYEDNAHVVEEKTADQIGAVVAAYSVRLDEICDCLIEEFGESLGKAMSFAMYRGMVELGKACLERLEEESA